MRLHQRLHMLDGPEGRALSFAERLRETGMEVHLFQDAERLDAALLETAVDLVLVHADHPDARAFVQHVRGAHATRGFACGLLGDRPAEGLPSLALALNADDLLTLDDPLPVLFSRIEVLCLGARLRRAVRRQEEVLSTFGVRAGPSAPTDADPLRILVTGSPGSRQATLIGLFGHGTRLSFVENAGDIGRHLRDGRYDALVASTADLVADGWPPAWLGATPVLVTAGEGWPPASHLSNRGQVEILHEPLPTELVSLRVRSWARRLAAIRWLRERGGDTGERAIRDHLTGLFSHGFAHAWLDRSTSAFGCDGEMLVAAFDWTGLAAINAREGYAAGDRALVDFASGLRRAVRAEDMLVRLGGARFGLIAEGLSDQDAPSRLRRIVDAGLDAVRAVGEERRLVLGITRAMHGERAGLLFGRARAAARPLGDAADLSPSDHVSSTGVVRAC